ncbi:MAG TPA: type II toxin-antitoxin system VapC family toxin [Candidatus Nanoarchaeia archaeon]|nr:type II toxin-antitoxin system VapC family toxin [Candidatus Nanoarchaeia archaeon]
MFLDSTFLIDFLRGKLKAVSFVEKNEFLPLFTSEINVFELIDGVYYQDQMVAQHLEKIFALLARINVLHFDRKAALKAGEISGRLTRDGEKIGELDCLIAGVALSNGILNFVTDNEKHYRKIKELKVIGY